MRPLEDPKAVSPSIADRTESVTRSPIRRMFDIAQHHSGDDLVHMEIGEPDFDTPEHIVEAASTAAAGGATHYTSNAGLPELRRAIAADLRSDREYDSESEIIVTAGAMEALSLAYLTLVDPGDEVLVPTPAWPNYRTHAVMAGGDFVELPLSKDDGFALDAELLAEHITDDTAVVVLTSPSNPTGQIYDADSIAHVVAAAAEHDAFVIADEVYKDLTYDTEAIAAVDSTDYPEHVVTVGSCSKTYAMTGWRVGWLAASPPVIDAALKFHESTVACAPAVSQHAAIAALTGGRSPIRSMRSAFHDRRDYVVDRVADLPGVSCPNPEGAFYAFLDFSCVGKEGRSPSDSEALAEHLLEEYGVVTAPGIGFGSHVDDHLRLSFANSRSRLEEGFDRIEAFLQREGIQ